nr:immunoglobulin light chain junction region [Macaca mulatta]
EYYCQTWTPGIVLF